MFNSFLYALWFFVPAGIANVTPILVSKMPWLERWTTPLDFGKQYGGQYIFGANKTWRGLVCGVIAAELIYLLQRHLAASSGTHGFFEFATSEQYACLPLFLGSLLGFGALAGDAIESFFKRRHHIAPGKTWFPFDQIDYIIGGCLFGAIGAVESFKIYCWILIAWFLAHLLFSYVGYLLKLKPRPI